MTSAVRARVAALVEVWAQRGAWRAHALCARLVRDGEVHVDVFMPRRGDVTSVKVAREVCARCSVQDECLDYALSASDTLLGIWAGTSLNERRDLRRAREERT